MREAVFTPVALEEGIEDELFFELRGYPEVAEGEQGTAILERLASMSAAYGTRLEIRDGRAHWSAERTGGVLRSAEPLPPDRDANATPDAPSLSVLGRNYPR